MKTVVHPRASTEKFSGKGQLKDEDREIAPLSLPPFYQWGLRYTLGACGQGSTSRRVVSRIPRERSFF